MSITYWSFDEVQRELASRLLLAPECAPRGEKIRETLACSFTLVDPRARLTASPARAANYGFAAGEFLWYLRGAEDLESIAYYNRRMSAFSDDGKTLHSAYGRRLRGSPPGRPSQWADVVSELVSDRDSRRAVMAVYSASDLRRARAPGGTRDVPCTLALQFFVRGCRLHLHATMRSNDAVWGLANDLFSFTLLQEAMLLDLRAAGLADLELGNYHHTAGSMHLYERHYAMAEEIAGETCGPAPAMPPLAGGLCTRALLTWEESLRAGKKIWPAISEVDGRTGEGWLLARLVEHRAKRNAAGVA